ncbi:hypothetical protein Pelo_15922 [Pelomyxa schiedti]|nr:hypothetical protein Pelo_15922 [Pelomyxa schiedti]
MQRGSADGPNNELEVVLSHAQYPSSVSDTLLCPVCLMPLVNPVEHRDDQCGNTFCRSCVASLPACPMCRKAWDATTRAPVMMRSLLASLNSLVIKCPQCGITVSRGDILNHIHTTCNQTCPGKPQGCPFSGPRADVLTHEATCPFVRIVHLHRQVTDLSNQVAALSASLRHANNQSPTKPATRRYKVTIPNTQLRVRAVPCISGTVVGHLAPGQIISVIRKCSDSEGNTWVQHSLGYSLYIDTTGEYLDFGKSKVGRSMVRLYD